MNAGMLRFANRHRRQKAATLDMDASLVETQKREARYSYRKRKAYQPLTTYWYEADLVLHSEFRDGKVPAGHEQLRLRSDTAGYQRELLRYCAEGRDERFEVIEFAVGVDVTVEFKRAVVRVAEEQWQPVVEGRGQEWAEVNFVPNWVAQGKKEGVYRFVAIRERFEQARLPGMGEQWELPFPAMEMESRGWYKVFGLVTNRALSGEEVIEWSRQRCGKGSACRTPGWRKRCMIREPCVSSWGWIWERSVCRMRRLFASFGTCWSAMSWGRNPVASLSLISSYSTPCLLFSLPLPSCGRE